MNAFGTLGAPIRLSFELQNRGRSDAVVPIRLGFSSGDMRIAVSKKGAQARIVDTACIDDSIEMTVLKPTESMEGAATLLRNRFEALFPEPGEYELAVTLDIKSNGRITVVAGMVDIVVEKPENRKQELLARRIFDDPALQTIMTFGGHCERHTNRLLESLMMNEQLANHYLYFDAKQHGSRCFNARGDMRRMDKFISEQTVMTFQEIESTIELIKASKADRSRAHAAMQHLLLNLKIKTKSLEMIKTTRVRLLNKLRSLGKSIQK
ncbi:MAG: hypothetical protein ACOVLE_11020 [Pirellula staleyi]